MNGASGECVSTIVTSWEEPCGERAAVVGIADRDVQAGQPLVELYRRRHRPGDEPEHAADARRERLGGQPQRQRVGHLGVGDRRQGEQQIAIVGRGVAGENVGYGGERRDPALRVGGDHGSSIITSAGQRTTGPSR